MKTLDVNQNQAQIQPCTASQQRTCMLVYVGLGGLNVLAVYVNQI